MRTLGLRGDTFKLLHHRGIPSPAPVCGLGATSPVGRGLDGGLRAAGDRTGDGRKWCRDGNRLKIVRVCGTGRPLYVDAGGGSLCRPSWRADHVTPVKQNRFLPKMERSRLFIGFCSARKPQCRRLPRGTRGWRKQVDASSVTCCVVSPGDLLVSFPSSEKKLVPAGTKPSKP